MQRNLLITCLLNVILVFAIGVVMLGAYTRLTDAGLGCPDWPGCYGKLILPDSGQAKSDAQALYPNLPIEPVKAWIEMIHRYAAGTLGLFILFFAGLSQFGPKAYKTSKALALSLVMILFFQAALGMWTVTLKLLPVVVMGHLLGGMTIASLLFLLRLTWSKWPQLDAQDSQRQVPLKPWVYLGLVFLIIQIALGGWVSSNYAGLACIGFPSCNQSYWPKLDLISAFNVFSPIGNNYQGGLLDSTARVTIQWIHRLWAGVTLVYLVMLSACIIKCFHNRLIRWFAGILIACLCMQFILGILNVIWMLKLPVAVMHNGMGLLLLLIMVGLCYTMTATQEAGA